MVNSLFKVFLTVAVVLGLGKASLWYFDFSAGFTQWQKPLCLLHNVEEWSCTELLQEENTIDKEEVKKEV